MNDTVIVPREVVEEVLGAASNFYVNFTRNQTYSGDKGAAIRRLSAAVGACREYLLAAAPPETEAGSLAEMVAELVNETAPDQGQTPSRAFALALSLQAAIASQSEAPKVEQPK